MRRISLTGLVALLAVVLAIGLGAWAVLRHGSGCAFAGSTCRRVLFIGNSYTAVNDLPGVFAGLVRSGGGAVEVRAIAPGGAFLADHAGNPEVVSAIAGTPWTAVVLQEQSRAPAASETRGRMVRAAEALATQARVDGADVVLLQTWAHRDGWPERGLDFQAMQAAIDAGYAQASAASGATIAPAGDAFRLSVAEAPQITLWQQDGSHPAPAGTYLAACVLYATMTGSSPVGLGDTDGLPAADAATLQRIAWEAVRG